MRILLAAAALAGLASCTQYQGFSAAYWFWKPPPGQLTLSNYRFDHASIEAVIASGPECDAGAAPAPATDFDLPYNGSRVIVAAPRTDICWRRQLADGRWSDWNRAFTASGRFVDSQL